MWNSAKRERTTVVLIDLAAAHPNTAQAPPTWKHLCIEYAQQISTAIERLFAHTCCTSCAHRWSIHFIDSSASLDISFKEKKSSTIPSRATSLANIQLFRKELQTRLQRLPFGENRGFGCGGDGIAKGLQELLDGVPLTEWSEDESVDSLLGIHGPNAMAMDRCSNGHDFLPRLYVFARVPTCEKDLEKFINSPHASRESHHVHSKLPQSVKAKLNRMAKFFEITRRAKRHGIRMTWVDSTSRRCESRAKMIPSLHRSFQNWLFELGWSGFTALHSLIIDRHIFPLRTLIRSLDQADVPTNSPHRRRHQNSSMIPLETTTVDVIIEDNVDENIKQLRRYFRANLTKLSSGSEIIDLDSADFSSSQIVVQLVSFAKVQDVEPILARSVLSYPEGKVMKPFTDAKNLDSSESTLWSSLFSGLLVNLARTNLYAIADLLYINSDGQVRKVERTVIQPITPIVAKVQTISCTDQSLMQTRKIENTFQSTFSNLENDTTLNTTQIGDLSAKFFETYLPNCVFMKSVVNAKKDDYRNEKGVQSWDRVLHALADMSSYEKSGGHLEYFKDVSPLGTDLQRNAINKFLSSGLDFPEKDDSALRRQMKGLDTLRRLRPCCNATSKSRCDKESDHFRNGINRAESKEVGCENQTATHNHNNHSQTLSDFADKSYHQSEVINLQNPAESNQSEEKESLNMKKNNNIIPNVASLQTVNEENQVNNEISERIVEAQTATISQQKNSSGVSAMEEDNKQPRIPIIIKFKLTPTQSKSNGQSKSIRNDYDVVEAPSALKSAMQKFTEQLHITACSNSRKIEECVRQSTYELCNMAKVLVQGNYVWDDISKIVKQSLKKGKHTFTCLQTAQKSIDLSGPSQARNISGELWVTVLQSYEQLVWLMIQNLRPEKGKEPQRKRDAELKRWIKRSSTILGCVRVLGEIAAVSNTEASFFREIFSEIFASVLPLFCTARNQIIPLSVLHTLYDEFEEDFPSFSSTETNAELQTVNSPNESQASGCHQSRLMTGNKDSLECSSVPDHSELGYKTSRKTGDAKKRKRGTKRLSASEVIRRAREQRDSQPPTGSAGDGNGIARRRFQSQITQANQNPLIITKRRKEPSRKSKRNSKVSDDKIAGKDGVVRRLEFPPMPSSFPPRTDYHQSAAVIDSDTESVAGNQVHKQQKPILEDAERSYGEDVQRSPRKRKLPVSHKREYFESQAKKRPSRSSVDEEEKNFVEETPQPDRRKRKLLVTFKLKDIDSQLAKRINFSREGSAEEAFVAESPEPATFQAPNDDSDSEYEGLDDSSVLVPATP